MTDGAALRETFVDKAAALRKEVKACPECRQRFSVEATFCPFDGTKLALSNYEAAVDPLLGITVDGRYQIIALLGEGGMGTVYEVRHRMLNRSFAMKVLRRDVAREPDLAARFTNEAKATGSIKHPHIVSITDFGQLVDATPFFVMELLLGQTLAQVLKTSGALEMVRAHSVLTQMASALSAAHEAGVVHRDLKPENVFLARPTGGATAVEEDDVKIVDFGAAKVLGASRITKTGIVFGTPHYMSPEQASGQHVDHRADVYAFGVIMYEMLTGRVPFEADTYMGVLTQHMFVQPKAPSAVRPDRAQELGALEEITMRALEKKPEDRYQTMHGLTVDLEKAAAGEVVTRSLRPSSLRPSPAEDGEPVRRSLGHLSGPVTMAPGVLGSSFGRSAALGALFGIGAIGLLVFLRGHGGRPAPPPPLATMAAVANPVPAPPPVASELPPPSPPPSLPPAASAGPAVSSAASPLPVGPKKYSATTPQPRPPPTERPPPRRSSSVSSGGELPDPWAK